jgi:uncharacterized oxidoreductase
MMKLRHRTILITGGSSGIGLELARQLLARDNTVIVTGRDSGKLRAAKESLPDVHVMQSDVSDPVAIRTLCDAVLAEFPDLDTLVNNAGVMRNVDLNLQHGLAELTQEIDTNLSGPIRMVQQLLSHLKGRPNALIVNVSSVLAFVPLPASPVYSAAKAALHAYTRSLRVQLQDTGVTVVELMPPAVDTPLFKDEFAREMEGQRLMDPATLARHAIAGIEAGKLELRPGPSNLLMMLSRLAPQFALRQMVKALQVQG